MALLGESKIGKTLSRIMDSKFENKGIHENA